MQTAQENQKQPTQDSSGRTTDPTLTGSKSPDSEFAAPAIEERDFEFDCPVHGKHIQRQIKLRKDWIPADCQLCRADEKKRRDQIDEDRKRRTEAEGRRAELERRISRAGIPPRFAGKIFDGFDHTDPATEKAFETCRSYAERFPDMRKAGASMIFCGNAGTGKTHLACAIAHEVIHTHGLSAVYLTAGRAFRMVKGTFSRTSDQTEQQVISSFAVPDLLIIDEMGVQYGSDAEKNILFEIINERYEAMLPTILITNLALDALRQFAGDRVIDRMKENGGKLVVFDWESRRGS